MFPRRQTSRIAASPIKFQPVCASQPSHKLLIRIRRRPAQLVIEMNDGNNDAKLRIQLNQQS
jgi:hypothetical protein